MPVDLGNSLKDGRPWRLVRLAGCQCPRVVDLWHFRARRARRSAPERTRSAGGRSAVDAVLLHVLFANDLSHKPTSATLLLARARQARDALGVRLDRVHDWAATIVLPAGL
jgi:hypothetical protein